MSFIEHMLFLPLVVSGPGVCIGDADRPISVEEIRDNFDKIMNMDDLKTHDNGRSIFTYMAPLLSQER